MSDLDIKYVVNSAIFGHLQQNLLYLHITLIT